MTRKRFKKLLMSVGIERDRAEAYARSARYVPEPYAGAYEKAWDALCELLDGSGGAQ